MVLSNDFSAFVRSLKLLGLFPSGTLFNSDGELTKKTPKQHLFPVVLCIISWCNAARIASHLIWIGDPNIKQGLNSGLIIAYFCLAATIRTIYMATNIRGCFMVWLKFLFDDHCPMWGALKCHTQEARKHRSKVVNFMHAFSWFYIIINSTLITTLAVTNRQSFQVMITPFGYIGDNFIYCLGIGIVAILQIITDSGAIFGNTYIVIFTIELASRFDVIVKWIQAKAKASMETSISDAKAFDINSIRMSHLHWYNRVKAFDKITRYVVGISMAFGFYGLLVNVYFIIWGEKDYLLITVWVSWAFICSVFLFCHLFSSAHLKRTTDDVVEALFQIPTHNLFKPENTTPSFNLLFFVNQCTAEPIALTFFDLFYLQYSAVMAVSIFFTMLSFD